MITGVVFTALRGFVNDRCYPIKFPQPLRVPAWPAIRYQVVSAVPVLAICGTDDGTTDEVRVQVDYVAQTEGAAVALRALGRVALMTVYPPCTREPGGFETFDFDTDTYRLSEDYMFHPSSPATS